MTSATTPSSAAIDHEVADRLRTAVNRLNRRLRQQSLGGISPAQASVLAVTGRLGSPTLGELARAEQIQPPSMTRLVAGMEEAGLLERTADASDRRVARVSLTPLGRKELARIRTLKTAYLLEAIESLDPVDHDRLEELVALLEQLGAAR